MPINNPSDKLILIVDDDDNVRDLLEFIVKKEGFKVEKCDNGKDAIEKVISSKPDLIILDLMLPGYGGFEIIRKLQAEETLNIPVIIITGKHMDRTTRELIKMERNVVEFMEKPIKMEVLALLLHKILKTSPGQNNK